MCKYEEFRVVVKPLNTCLACLAVPSLGCWMQTGRSHAGHTNYTTIILEFVYTADQAGLQAAAAAAAAPLLKLFIRSNQVLFAGGASSPLHKFL